MKNLLQINSSLYGADGQSSQMAAHFVAKLQASDPALKLTIRDLAVEPVPHLTAETFAAFLEKPELRSAEQQTAVAASDALIEELRSADVIVIGLPLYNFGVPSTLKAWIDHVARAGVTFRYTDSGPVGLLQGKKAYLMAARGGEYRGTPGDTQTGYMNTLLSFLGINDIEYVYAEGLAMGDKHRQQSLDQAYTQTERLAA